MRSYLDGQEARAERTWETIFETVGGEAEYRALIGWAQDALSPEEVESFNALAHGQDLNGFRLAVAGLHGRYQDEMGGTRAKTRIVGDGGGGGAGDVYGSWAEVTKDMRDPRYKTDPSYQKTVAAKLDRSPLGGVKFVGDKVYRS